MRIWASRWRSTMIVASGLALVALAAATAGLSFANGSASDPTYTVAGNTPGFVQNAKDLGAVDPSTVISVTVWLKLHNEAQLDALAKAQSQKGNASYHQWISQSQFDASYSPTSQELNSVENFLSAHNLTLANAAENNLYVEVSGTVGAVEKAFHVQIDNYSVDGGVVRSNKADPSVNGSAGAHIAAITGMDDLGYHPNIAFPNESNTQSMVPLSSSPKGAFFAAQCFTAPESHTFTSSSATASYSGNRYGSDITAGPPNLSPCGYQPSELWQAYSMNSLYSQGLTGAGQTIVITDAFGDPTIQYDANVFSQIYGLPALTSSNFHIYQAPGTTNNPRTRGKFGDPTGWQGEITLDVEWAHAMAPGANIALVIAPNNGNDLDEAVNWAIVHHLGNVITNSWGGPEGQTNPAVFNRMNRVLESAAVQGVDVNFSSGDNGDDTSLIGYKSAEFPNSSPFATSVGGTSVALDSKDNLSFQTGWGTNLTRISDTVAKGAPPIDPPLSLGFVFGAGGGVSRVFPKPAFQSALPGTMRKTPDVGMIADPYTGVEIIETSGGQLGVGVIGGTSLASPVFSAIMAIATQAHGSGLGQAAPLLYGLATSQTTSTPLYDVTAVSSPTNVSGSISDASGTRILSADDLAAPLDGTTSYLSAFYNGTSTRWYVITFGTDSSLTTSAGWDDVTGLGTPNGAAFVAALK